MIRTTRSAFLLVAALLTGLAFAQDAEGFVERPDGARIYYQARGEGVPMMLVHGYPLNSGLFRDNVGPLAEAGYRVITPDLRGFGQSVAPNSEASMQIYAEDMLAVMDELGVEQAIVGGMSMGGMTLFEMYRQAPERFSGIVLIDTAHTAPGIAEANLWRGTALQAEQDGVGSLVDFLMPDMLSGDTRRDDRALVEYYSGLIRQASVEGAVGGGNALAERPDSTPTLSDISVPTLIVVGIEDTLTPLAIAMTMRDTIGDAQLSVVEGSAHGAILEGAEEANEAILDWAQGLR